MQSAYPGCKRIQALSPECCAGDNTSDIDKAKFQRAEDFPTRRPKQYSNKPFSTTTIGSFPQTPGVVPRAPMC